MQDLNFLQDFKFDHLDQLEPEVCTLCEEFCTSGNLCQSCPCWWWRFDDGDDGEDVDDEGNHDDGYSLPEKNSEACENKEEREGGDCYQQLMLHLVIW